MAVSAPSKTAYGKTDPTKTEVNAPTDGHPWHLQTGLPPPDLPLTLPKTRREDAPPWMRLLAFRDLPDLAIDRLQDVMQHRRYEPSQVLMQQGDPGDGLLVLNAGS